VSEHENNISSQEYPIIHIIEKYIDFVIIPPARKRYNGIITAKMSRINTGWYF